MSSELSATTTAAESSAKTASLNADIVIVGAGIAGGALATVLARAGIDVLLLERTLEHQDVVRGEWIAPWGVAEVKSLGLYDLYMQNGGHHLGRHITFSEGVAPDDAACRALDLSTLLPEVPGPLCLGHPRMCTLLNEAAVAAGARLLRSVRRTEVLAGATPTVRFEHAGVAHTLRPKLVVGADGRNGLTRQQLGMALHEDPQHHWFSGMLVEDVQGWPADLQCISTEGDVNALVFPQSGSRVRLYLGFATAQRGRFHGATGPHQFLEAFALKSIPGVEGIVRGRPAGPCNVYPNHDTWIDVPCAPGVVLIGDAAGRNDPITGQGLSITHRDVRLLRDILLSSSNWSGQAFAPYARERAERMRRLRFAAAMTSVREAEFGPEASVRRHRLHALSLQQPSLMAATFAAFIGPDALPAEAFSSAAWDAFIAA